MKAYLQQPGADGVSLYGHLTEVLATMLENKTADPLGAIESISAQVKGTHFTASSAKAPDPPAPEPSDEGGEWHKASNKLLTVAPPLPSALVVPLLALHLHARALPLYAY